MDSVFHSRSLLVSRLRQLVNYLIAFDLHLGEVQQLCENLHQVNYTCIQSIVKDLSPSLTPYPAKIWRKKQTSSQFIEACGLLLTILQTQSLTASLTGNALTRGKSADYSEKQEFQDENH